MFLKHSKEKNKGRYIKTRTQNVISLLFLCLCVFSVCWCVFGVCWCVFSVCVFVCVCRIGALRTKLYLNLPAFEPSLVDFVPPHLPCKGYVNNVVVVQVLLKSSRHIYRLILFPSSVLWTPLPSLPHAKHLLYPELCLQHRDQFSVQSPDVLFRVGRPYIFIRL